MQRCLFTGHIVDTDGLLEMLIMRHHLREKRPLCHPHHGRLLLIIRLQESGEEAALERKRQTVGANRGGHRAPNISSLFVTMKKDDEASVPGAPPRRALQSCTREKHQSSLRGG